MCRVALLYSLVFCLLTPLLYAFLYIPVFLLVIYLFGVHHCVYSVRLFKFPTRPSPIRGPIAQKTARQITCQSPGTAICIAAQKGRRPGGSRGHLYIMGLFEVEPTCRFCGKETETVQHILCCCEALARQRYNIFGNLTTVPKDISTASIKDLCLFIKSAGLLNLC